MSVHIRKTVATAMMACVGVGIAGCKPDEAVKQPTITGRGTREPIPPASGGAANDAPAAMVDAPGVITGTILFKGKAPAGTIDTSMDPACSLGSAKAQLPVEQFAVKGDKLANVFLYVKSGPPAATQGGPTSAQPVVLDQKNCQYVPHVIGVAAGGYVEFRNSDPTMHNVHTNPTDIGNETVDISEGPHGSAQTKQFRRAESMIPVRCNNHPWMNAFINVSATPYFAVSDVNGHFEIKGLPAGNYVIGAVHEKMGEKTMQVTVAARSVAKAEFSFAQ